MPNQPDQLAKRIITPEHQANIKIAKDIQISSLPPLEILERIKALREANKLVKAFPDTGPLRRELYPKQMEFFAAGKDHDERLFLAANKCISPWTPIETGTSTRQCSELIGVGDFDVRSWDGNSRCNRVASPVFLKGIEPMFRIYLEGGATFDCTANHRVADQYGDFSSLSQVLFGANARMKHVLLTKKRDVDYSASCANRSHLYDELLLSQLEICPRLFPLLGDVLEHALFQQSQTDASAHRFEYSPYTYNTVQNDPDQIADLCAGFLDPADYIDAELCFYAIQEFRPLLRAYGQFQLTDEFLDRLTLSGYKCREVFGLCGLSSFGVLLPTETISILGANINFIVPIGPQPVLDFTVNSTHCYESVGVIHHNTGKSHAGGYEAVVHCTGLYPHWWTGKRFEHPTTGWICNNTAIDTRDINQQIILGDPGQFGTGLLPKSVLIGTKSKSSVPDGVELIYIKHVSGGQSVIVTKAYEQGRLKFQGRNIHWIWNDEEVPADVYGEELLRIVVTNGIIFNTYTPILGLTPITVKFLRQSVNKDTLPFKFDDDRKVS